MKIRSAAILTALLAGAVAIGAHPYSPQQGQRRGAQQYHRRGQAGPPCRLTKRAYRQQQGAQQYHRRGQAVPQYRSHRYETRQWNQDIRGQQNRQGRYAPQQKKQWNQRGEQRLTPQQRKQLMQKRTAALKRFDRDGDGRLSEKERNAARKSVQQRRGEKNPGESPDIRKKPKNQE